MIDDHAALSPRADVADLLADRFPGHTMQRMRTADGKYRYLYVSSGVMGSFGLDPALLMQAEAVDHAWVHDDDRARFVAALEVSARDLSALDIEVRVESPGGGYRWVRSLGQPRREPDGSTIWDGVALDVTDRREALDALERAMAEARKSEVAEGRFAYIAAKDLGAPLGDLRRAVAALAASDLSEGGELAPLITDLSTRFATFERALFATKGLVEPAAPPPSSPVPSGLTKRQAEILAQIREGASNRMIADALDISEGTVKLHVSAILKKLGARNRTEAARL